MCGISGVLSAKGDVDCRALVSRIVEDQHMRGPDANAIWGCQTDCFELVLGHNRLSIIDLSLNANQPMACTRERYQIVYNGEIYNYLELRAELEAAGVRFRTQSDTEVILESFAAWGTKALDRFIGMFAFALFDSVTAELLLVRDRFGVKPLYYWTDARTLVFASTPTVIATWAGLKPNLDYVSRGIRYKYYEDDTDIAPYSGLMALEPSHLLRIRVLGGSIDIKKEKYYDLASRVAALTNGLAATAEADLNDQLLELLRSACQLRQRSDVPLGLSLSGGIDSTAIAAIVSESQPFAIGYTFSNSEERESEGPLVVELAKQVPIRPHFVWPSQSGEVVDLFWRTLRAQDAPFPHASVMAQHAVFRAARADGTVVLLGGQGGDEAFMGYRKFFLFYAQSVLRGARLADLARLLPTVLPLLPAIAARARLFFAERRRYATSGGGMDTRLLLPPVAQAASMGLANGVTNRERQQLDVTRFSLPTLLRYEDRNSMGNAVESRLPFLDHRLVEFGIALPERAKLHNGFGKWILRKAMAGKVPDSIRLNRDKRGFDVNQRLWIEGGLGRTLRHAIRERRASISQWLPKAASVDQLFSDHTLGSNPQAFKEAVTLIWLGDRC